MPRDNLAYYYILTRTISWGLLGVWRTFLYQTFTACTRLSLSHKSFRFWLTMTCICKISINWWWFLVLLLGCISFQASSPSVSAWLGFHARESLYLQHPKITVLSQGPNEAKQFIMGLCWVALWLLSLIEPKLLGNSMIHLCKHVLLKSWKFCLFALVWVAMVTGYQPLNHEITVNSSFSSLHLWFPLVQTVHWPLPWKCQSMIDWACSITVNGTLLLWVSGHLSSCSRAVWYLLDSSVPT